MRSAIAALKRPDHHVLRLGEVAQRFDSGQVKLFRKHRVELDRGLGRADPPRRVGGLEHIARRRVGGAEDVRAVAAAARVIALDPVAASFEE